MALWLDTHDAALKSHVDAGKLSFAGMAAAINSEFKTDFSRNAAIGRASRLGLTSVKKMRDPDAPPPGCNRRKKKSTANTGQHRVVTRIVKANGNSNGLRVSQSIETEQYQLRCVEIECLVPFADVTGCRYTDSSGPFLFCDGPQQPGSSYCTPHFHLTHQAVKPFLDKVWRRDAA